MVFRVIGNPVISLSNVKKQQINIMTNDVYNYLAIEFNADVVTVGLAARVLASMYHEAIAKLPDKERDMLNKELDRALAEYENSRKEC